MRRLAALAVVLAACSKGKDTSPSAGSGSASVTVGDAAAPSVTVEVAVPEVAPHGYAANPPPARVSVTPSAVVVDGRQVLALEGGQVPASAIVDGRIPAIVGGLSAAGADPRFVIAVDKSLPYGLLVQVLSTLTGQGVRSFGVLARTGGAPVMLPLDLPDTGAAAAGAPGATARPAAAGALAASVEVEAASVVPESSLDGEGVKRKVSGAYLAGVKRCVETAGSRDATPGGSISVRFDIEETGTASEPTVSGVPQDVAACITEQMTSWRFPVPRGGAAAPVRVTATMALAVSYHDARNSDQVAPPTSTASHEAPPLPTEPPLGMMLSLDKDAIVVWSRSGREGTLAKPRLRLPLDAHVLSAALEELVTKRWAKTSRHEQDLDIVVMLPPTTAMQTVAEILGAVRASPKGTQLFPRVMLAQ